MKKVETSEEEVAKILKLLGDRTRITIIGLLHHHECCVCEFVEILEMSQPAISQHLRKLRDVGLVKEKRNGHWIFYSLNHHHVAMDLVKDILKHIPDQREKITELERSGRRVSCN